MNNELTQAQQHVNELINATNRRMRILELRKATMGMNTPPEIVIEIEDTKHRLAELRKQLQVEFPISNSSLNDVRKLNSNQKQRIDIIFQGDFSHMTPEVKLATVRAVAGIAGVEQVEIQFIENPHENIARLDVPENAAEKLILLQKEGDKDLKDMGVAWVKKTSTNLHDGDNQTRREEHTNTEHMEMIEGLSSLLKLVVVVLYIIYLLLTSIIFSWSYSTILASAIAAVIVVIRINTIPSKLEDMPPEFSVNRRIIWIALTFVIFLITLILNVYILFNE